MALSSFPYTLYNDPNGDPLSNGYVLLTLTMDASTSGVQLCAGMTVKADLDDTGSIDSDFQVWSTDDMLPAGVLYNLRAYTEQGQLVYELLGISVTNAPPGLLGFGEAFGSSFGS